jgi:Flp pilus assembly protein TadD
MNENYTRAEELYTEGHNLGDINAYAGLGRAKWKLGKTIEALNIFHVLCDEQKYTAGACRDLATMYNELGKKEYARKYKKRSRDLEEQKIMVRANTLLGEVVGDGELAK